jgi:hypothetical protein
MSMPLLKVVKFSTICTPLSFGRAISKKGSIELMQFG